jgi:hypothetical protein
VSETRLYASRKRADPVAPQQSKAGTLAPPVQSGIQPQSSHNPSRLYLPHA